MVESHQLDSQRSSLAIAFFGFSKNYQLSTTYYQLICRFSGIYIQEFISAEDSRRYNFKASFYFKIFCLFCLPSYFD
jgi:hypothetical protein